MSLKQKDLSHATLDPPLLEHWTFYIESQDPRVVNEPCFVK